MGEAPGRSLYYMHSLHSWGHDASQQFAQQGDRDQAVHTAGKGDRLHVQKREEEAQLLMG